MAPPRPRHPDPSSPVYCRACGGTGVARRWVPDDDPTTPASDRDLAAALMLDLAHRFTGNPREHP